MSSKKPQGCFNFRVKLVTPGGWRADGKLMWVRQISADGLYQKISARHFYCQDIGRDIYPDREQLEQLLAGDVVVLGLRQWA